MLIDPGSNNSGYYELLAVVTHEGRTANSGHYVAWTKVDDGMLTYSICAIIMLISIGVVEGPKKPKT